MTGLQLHSTAGVTLVEILVAFTMLAVGAVALSAWQLSSLHAAGEARKQQQLNALVGAELRYRKIVPSYEPHCVLLADLQLPAALTCRVSVEACHLAAGLLHCSAAAASAPQPRVRRITVSAGFEGAAWPLLELSSLAAGFPVP